MTEEKKNAMIKAAIISSFPEDLSEANYDTCLDDTLSTLGVDSLDFVELAMSIEEVLDISITDQALSDVKTLRDLHSVTLESFS